VDGDDNGADALGARIAQLVEERRAKGAYEGDLEGWMDEHYRRIASRPPDPPLADLMAAVARLQAYPPFHVPTAPRSDPLRGSAHRVVGTAIRGHTTELVEQLNAFADVLKEAMASLSGALQTPRPLVSQLQSVQDEVAEMRRELNRLADRLGEQRGGDDGRKAVP